MRLARSLLLLTCLIGLVACTSGRRGGGGGGGSFSEGDDDDAPTGAGDLAGLDLLGLSINQGVEIRLLHDRTDWLSNRNADIVPNRPGVLRIYVEPQDEWEPRDVLATVEFEDGTTVRVEESVGDGGSDPEDLSSTINIELTAEDLAEEQGFSVRLEEVEGTVDIHPGTTEYSRWPQDEGEFEDLDLRSSGVIDLRIVPVVYEADGSDRLPDTSATGIGHIHDLMMKLYPASEIRVTVEDPMDWPYTVAPNGSGWSELLQQIYYLRDQRNMPGSSYTYGLFAPATSIEQYCSQGCVAGLSINVSDASYSDSRVSIGMGFGTLGSAETLVHEVGHAHGRNHAPCTQFGNINNVDPSYPYSNANLGVPGYDILEGDLKRPGDYADLLAYCDPIWVSDYTWNAFHDRIRAVGPSSQILGDLRTDLMSVIVDGDGVRSPQRLTGRPITGNKVVTVLEADGAEVTTEARFLPFDHLEGGLLVFEAPAEDALAIDVPGHGILAL